MSKANITMAKPKKAFQKETRETNLDYESSGEKIQKSQKVNPNKSQS